MKLNWQVTIQGEGEVDSDDLEVAKAELQSYVIERISWSAKLAPMVKMLQVRVDKPSNLVIAGKIPKPATPSEMAARLRSNRQQRRHLNPNG